MFVKLPTGNKKFYQKDWGYWEHKLEKEGEDHSACGQHTDQGSIAGSIISDNGLLISVCGCDICLQLKGLFNLYKKEGAALLPKSQRLLC